jgi:hypothetical protein
MATHQRQEALHLKSGPEMDKKATKASAWRVLPQAARKSGVGTVYRSSHRENLSWSISY